MTPSKKKELLYKRDGNICGICKERFTVDSDVNVDHIQPRSKGGSDYLENLQLAHVLCNFRKGNGEVVPKKEKPKVPAKNHNRVYHLSRKQIEARERPRPARFSLGC